MCDKIINYHKSLNPFKGNLVRVINAQAPFWGGLDGGNNRLFASDNYNLYELNPQDGTIINSFYTINPIYGIGFTLERLFTSITWGALMNMIPIQVILSEQFQQPVMLHSPEVEILMLIG